MGKNTNESNTVTVRELRNQGGQVLDRVLAGEQLTITRDGQPVAELSPLSVPTNLTTLKKRASKLKAIDPISLRNDLDEIVDLWL
ncbi:MAG: type II toxin-antitoxin system prevent-host-death family antitoxin [Ilumatobacteraceae bacterium]|jgi:prevent-host-death family protein|nr:type II toxin-antitoxin system prevent-host-death family antitoxin [Ilumatobacteraceae bacterium]MDP4976680.1 type II toxin-antitoxin system prevent-host-death family antitoxin [Ilumatobacteraceae bacterium]